MKFNRGGVVSMAVGGSAPKQFTDFDLQQYKKAQDAEGLTPAEQVMKQSQDMAKFKAQGYTFDPARMDKFFNVDTTTGIANAAGMTSSLTTNPVTPPTPATPAAKSVTIGGSNDINNVFSGTTSGSVLGFNNTLPPGVIAGTPAPAPAPPPVADPMNIMGSNDITGVRSGTDTQVNKLLVGDDGLTDLGRFKQNLRTKDPSGRLFKINEDVEASLANGLSKGQIYLNLEKEGYSPEEIIEATGAVGKDADEIKLLANVRSAVAPETATDVTFANTRNGIVRVEPGQKIPPYSTVTDSASYLAQEQKRVAPTAKSTTFVQTADGLVEVPAGETIPEGKVVFEDVLGTGVTLERVKKEQAFQAAPDYVFIKLADGSVERIKKGDPVPNGEQVGIGAFFAANPNFFGTAGDAGAGAVGAVGDETSAALGAAAAVPSPADGPFAPGFFYRTEGGELGKEYSKEAAEERGTLISEKDLDFLGGLSPRLVALNGIIFDSINSGTDNVTLFNELTEKGYTKEEIIKATNNEGAVNAAADAGATVDANGNPIPAATAATVDANGNPIPAATAATVDATAATVDADGNPIPAVATLAGAIGARASDPAGTASGLKQMPDSATLTADNITTPGAKELLTEGKGKIAAAQTAKAAGTDTTKTASTVTAGTGEEITAEASAPDVTTSLLDVDDPLKKLSDSAKVTAKIKAIADSKVTSELISAAEIAQAQTVTTPASRTIKEAEKVVAIADAEKAAKFVEKISGAQADPTALATVQGQLASLMTQFEDGQIPPWAAGAMRVATAQMAARGLGASSMAGQAIIQATMEAAIPIATSDAATIAQFELTNLSNRQERAMLSAQQRAQFMNQEFDQAFQARVANAAKVSDIANINFNATQQVALENAKLAQTVDLTNIGNKQAVVMAEAAQIANLELTNLNNRQQAAVQNAQSFLQIDLTNASNQQQTDMFKAQSNIQAIFSDQGAENAALQFNASSGNQTDQFYANLKSQVGQFNATQQNAMEQFDAEQSTVVSKFNAELAAQRDQFNAQNQLVIEQSNAQWRRDIATVDNASNNVANQFNAQSILDISNTAYAQLWQAYRDNVEFVWTSTEQERERDSALAVTKINADASKYAAKTKEDAANSAAWGTFVFDVLKGF